MDPSTVVPASYVGWYLFAASQRYAEGSGFATIGYQTAADVPPLTAGTTVAMSAPVGPITAQ